MPDTFWEYFGLVCGAAVLIAAIVLRWMRRH
jgi:hypothetical protein